MWIAIAGQAGHGKDTIGEIIDELWKELHYNGSNFRGGMNFDFYTEFQTVKFADPINKSIAAITGLPLSHMTDRTKYNIPIDWLGGKTIRDLKQLIGQGMKPILGDNIWIKSAFTKVPSSANVKITDLRFPLELEFCVINKAILILVERPGYVDDTLQEHNKTDTSETSVSLLERGLFNCIIINDGTRKELKQKVKEFLETREEWKKTKNNSTFSKRDF